MNLQSYLRLLLAPALFTLAIGGGCGSDPEPEPEPTETTEIPETSEEPEPLLQPPATSVVSVTQQVETSTRRTIQFSNVGQGALTWSLQSDADWIAFEATEGELARRETADIVVDLTCPSEPDTYEGLIRLESNDVNRPRVNLTLRMTCTPFPVGSLEIRINGLPPELAPPLSLVPRDPESGLEALELEAEFLHTGIRPGQYDVLFPEVTSEDEVTTWLPDAESVGVEVRSNQSALVSTRYQRVRGTLSIEIELEDEEAPEARVRVTGPDGFEELLTDSATLENLIPGVYRIEAQGRVAEDELGVYRPEPDEIVHTLRSGAEDEHTIRYALIRGEIGVGVGGLPDSLDPQITVTGPRDFSATVGRGDVLEDLVPGPYVFSAPVVTREDGLESFAPTMEERVVQLASGASRTVDFTYVVGRGQLRVNVRGALPSAQQAQLVLTGPEDFEESFGFSRTFEGLAAGSYTLRAEDVTLADGIRRFRPDQTEVTLTVGSNAQEEISIFYEELLAALQVRVFGEELPAEGIALNTRIIGPAGFSVDLTSRTQTFENIPPGDYAIRSGRINAPDGEVFQPRINVQEVNRRLEAGVAEPVVVEVEYVRVSTTLDIDIRGLPPEDVPTIRITGPGGFDQNVSQSTALLDLTPGEYTVFASNVASVDGITNYRPNFQQRTVDLVDETTTQVVVQFAPQPGQLSTSFISGVPEGALPRFVVSRTSPTSFLQTFEQGQTIPPLLPAQYEVRALALTGSGGLARYDAIAIRDEGDDGEGLADDTIALTISSGETSSAQFRYELVPGSLEVLVEGLPSSLDPVFTIFGPGGPFSPGAPVRIDDLIPGVFEVGAGDVTDPASEARFQPQQRTQSATVRSGELTTVTIVYEGEPGLLTLSTSGLPANTLPDAILVGPLEDEGDPILRPIEEASLVFPNLPTGTYELRVFDIERESGTRIYALQPEDGVFETGTDGSGREYRALTINLGSGDRPFVNIRYRLQPGVAGISLTGLDSGAIFTLRLDGPEERVVVLDETDFDESTTTWIGELAPGLWTISVIEDPVLEPALRWSFSGEPEDLALAIDSRVTLPAELSFALVPGNIRASVLGVDLALRETLVLQLTRPVGDDCAERDPASAVTMSYTFAPEDEDDNRFTGLAPGRWCVEAPLTMLGSDDETFLRLAIPEGLDITSGDNGVFELNYLRVTFQLVASADNLLPFIYTLIFDPEDVDLELVEVDERPAAAAGIIFTTTADTGTYTARFSEYTSLNALPEFPVNQQCLDDIGDGDPDTCRIPVFVPGARLVFPALQAVQTVTVTSDDFDLQRLLDVEGGEGDAIAELDLEISAWYEHTVPEFTIEVLGLDPDVSPADVTLSLVHPFERGEDPAESCPPLEEDELDPCGPGEEEACLEDNPQRGIIGTGDTFSPPRGTMATVQDELFIGCYRYTTTGTIELDGRVYELAEPAEGYVLLGPDADLQTLVLNYVPDEDPATLRVNVEGVASLPSGESPALTLTGPFEFNESFSTSRVFEDLRTGQYTLSAENVDATVDGVPRRWAPSPASQTITLGDDDDVTRTVTYAEVFGSLTLTLEDLPASLDAGVTVTGPGDFSQTVDSSGTLSDLQPGSYRIQAGAVAGSGGSHIPDQSDFNVTVAFGATATATVSYTFEPDSSD